MPVNPSGYPYPNPSDPVAAGANDIKALADKIPRILSGRVTGAGVAQTPGITVVRNAVGDYTVTFLTAFVRVPAVTVTCVNATGSKTAQIMSGSPTINSVRVQTVEPNVAARDQDFAFVAVEPPA